MSSFTFSCDKENHPSGLGAWKITLSEDGIIMIFLNQAEHETSFGPFQLTEEENETVWGLIKKMQIPALSSSARMGIPDEVIYTFTIHLDDGPHNIWMWMGDAQKIVSVYGLVTEIDRLIKRYAGQQAHLS